MEKEKDLNEVIYAKTLEAVEELANEIGLSASEKLEALMYTAKAYKELCCTIHY